MLTESMARCIAKIECDGNLYYRYIRYSNNCEILLNEFAKDIRKEFGNIKLTKGVGKSDYYKLNLNNSFVKNLIKLDWILTKKSILPENENHNLNYA